LAISRAVVLTGDHTDAAIGRFYRSFFGAEQKHIEARIQEYGMKHGRLFIAGIYPKNVCKARRTEEPEML
jgi:hypothetical protein